MFQRKLRASKCNALMDYILLLRPVTIIFLRRLNTLHQDLVHIRPLCPSDIPPDRGELKGGKIDEHTNFATFLLAGIIVKNRG